MNTPTPNTHPPTPGEVLRAAAFRIAQCGLAKSVFYDFNTGSYCATGAIHKELCTLRQIWKLRSRIIMNSFEEVHLVAEVLGLDARDGAHDAVADWNNSPERTQEEVVSALLAAAELWESRQVREYAEQVYEYLPEEVNA